MDESQKAIRLSRKTWERSWIRAIRTKNWKRGILNKGSRTFRSSIKPKPPKKDSYEKSYHKTQEAIDNRVTHTLYIAVIEG